ncbi:MAG: TRAP transporter substrate-binding protein [Defluviitaleaceae bacterium]|nr:TRAP transporter substrate-binding protein [Defluviitaleaceae bacterium]
MKIGRLTKSAVSLAIVGGILTACAAPAAPAAPAPQTEAPGAGTQAEAPAPQDVTVWRYGHAANYDNPWHLSAVYFADLVEEMSGGRLVIEIFPNNTLGGEMDLLNGIQLGTADMTNTAGSFEVFAPTAALLEAPWAFRDEEHFKMMIDGEIGQSIMQDFRAANFVPLFHNMRTPRMLTSNFPVTHPSDMVGERLRLPNVPLQMQMWAATGASPQSVALAETFMALSQGVVTMQENPFDLIYNNSFFEVQQYANLTEHVLSAIIVVVGADQFYALPADLQDIVMEAAAQAQIRADELYFQYRDHFRDRLIENGMTMNADVDRDAFRAVMLPAIQEFLEDRGLWDIYEEIVALGN